MSPTLPPAVARGAAGLLVGALLAGTVSSVAAQTAGTPPASPASPAPPAPAASAPAAAAPQRVEITGGRSSDDETRRRSTAAKIVIGREEIEKFGDATVGEVLRRLPGVTTPGAPGRGGPPRLRGMGGGYTQLLLDGQRVPPGFSLEQLSPEQIERIEILRAPTGETGARAVAGTINIITREGFRRRLNELRMGFGLESGQWAPGLFWTHNNSLDALTYTLSAAVFRPWRETSSHVHTRRDDPQTGTVLEDSDEAARSLDRRQGLHLNARLQWRLDEQGNSLVLMPSLFHNSGETERPSTLVTNAGTPLFERSTSFSTSRNTSARLNTQWRQRLGAARLELNAGAGQFESTSDSTRAYFGGSPPPSVDESASIRDRSATLTSKLSWLLGGADDGSGAHNLVTGLELEALQRDETRQTLSGDVLQATEFEPSLSASSRRVALYAQDEWSLDKHWALHLGLRWEGITTRGEAEAGVRPENVSRVTTPLAHLLWKPDPARRDQIRLSLTRSYRSPTLGALIARPSYNTRAPLPGSNTPTTADSAGNPQLRPELASGVDLAFERFLDRGGVLSANLFYRRIRDLMRRQLAEEPVTLADGSVVQRWTARQRNVGAAVSQGLELEAKFRLDQAIADAWPVEVRSNLSLYRSRVEGLPGPDNRLEGQARATANLGADYRLRRLPLTLGGNLNWVPAVRTQLSDEQVVTTGRKRVFDAYALWTFSPAVALRLLASNLAPNDYTSANLYQDATHRAQSFTVSDTATNWQLRLELKL